MVIHCSRGIKMTDSDILDMKSSLPDIPPETCPFIDRVLTAVDEVLQACASGLGKRGRAQFETVDDIADHIEMALSGAESDLETIRKHNSDLRDLGVAWYEFAKENVSE